MESEEIIFGSWDVVRDHAQWKPLEARRDLIFSRNFSFIAWRRRLITQKRLPMLFVSGSPIATKTFLAPFHHNDVILSILIRESFGETIEWMLSRPPRCCRRLYTWIGARRWERMKDGSLSRINYWKSLATHCNAYAPKNHEMSWDLSVQVASQALTALLARILEHRKFLFSFFDCTVMVQQPDTREIKKRNLTATVKTSSHVKTKQMLILSGTNTDEASTSFLFPPHDETRKAIWSALLLREEVSLPTWHSSHSFWRENIFSHNGNIYRS